MMDAINHVWHSWPVCGHAQPLLSTKPTWKWFFIAWLLSFQLLQQSLSFVYLVVISPEGRLLGSGRYVQSTRPTQALLRGAVTEGAMWTAVNAITTALSLQVKPSINVCPLSLILYNYCALIYTDIRMGLYLIANSNSPVHFIKW